MRLNVQGNGVQSLLNDLNFRFTPTFILLDANGTEVWRTNGSIDPQTINVTPKSAGHRQSRKVKKTTDDGVQTNICEMPQPVESYEY